MLLRIQAQQQQVFMRQIVAIIGRDCGILRRLSTTCDRREYLMHVNNLVSGR
ncbi:MAG: hypothetical protein KJN94_09910 [Gammaproteobacteria bacterium]|nr:hypothetical protein [Gammaproteobacteria bacterium]